MLNSLLKDIKVIDLSGVLAGPSVAMFLAELGAHVIKIENPNTQGDITRQWKNPKENPKENLSAYYLSVNAFKEVRYLNLLKKSDLENLYELVKSADILITNFKYKDDVKLAVHYDLIKSINPTIIYVAISGFGKNNPRVAFDLILQAETGFMHLNREEQNLPNKIPVALIDVLCAHQIKEGILLALYKKLKVGSGAYVHCSLYDAAVVSLVNQGANYSVSSYNPPPLGSKHPNIAPYGEIFKTKDNQLITFAIGSDIQFKKLCEVINLHGLNNDTRFISNQNRVINRGVLYDILQKNIEQINCSYLYDICIQNNIPVGLIKDIEQVMNNLETQKLIKPFTVDNKTYNILTSIAFEIL